MSIDHLGPVYGPPGLRPRQPEAETAGGAVGNRSPESTGLRSVPRRSEQATDTAPLQGLPAEAPPGTDPDLWSVLTAEERRYFARAQAMGPLTYSPGRFGMAELGLQRGGRVDIKV